MRFLQIRAGIATENQWDFREIGWMGIVIHTRYFCEVGNEILMVDIWGFCGRSVDP